jgi:hypothetical protein
VPPGRRIKSFGSDYAETCKDMELNRWTERRACGVLLGSAATEAEVRSIGRKWLSKGTACLSPASIRDLR